MTHVFPLWLGVLTAMFVLIAAYAVVIVGSGDVPGPRWEPQPRAVPPCGPDGTASPSPGAVPPDANGGQQA
jgi:hypothetical protein